MAYSDASTVPKYLASLPPDRRAFVSAIRKVMRANLPDGYKETMGWGMISYGIPLSRYPNTYNNQPLCYAALASQKNFVAVYLMNVYGSPTRLRELKDRFAKAGKKLDMGKSCLRFRKLEDVPLDVIGKMVAGTSMEEFIAIYEASRRR